MYCHDVAVETGRYRDSKPYQISSMKIQDGRSPGGSDKLFLLGLRVEKGRRMSNYCVRSLNS